MMKNSLPFLLFALITVCSCVDPKPTPKGLDTKLIASEYSKGVVKIIMADPELEKEKPGKGYLSRGSGFVVTKDGYIFTNKHVVETAVKGYIYYDYIIGKEKKSKIDVYSDDIINNKNLLKVHRVGHTIPLIQVFNGKSENDYTLYKAEVVAIGAGAFDGALLKIVSDINDQTVNTNFTALPLGNSDNVSQGEKLCVFGYPSQFNGSSEMLLKDMSTLSVGIMSGSDFVMNTDYGYIKTDAEIHPGNSGGPVFDENNKVIGIATAKGNKTGIGLVGGINGMYYISAIDSKAHRALINLGLTLPTRSTSINTIKGDKQPLKSKALINAAIALRVKKENQIKNPPIKYGNYVKSKIFFSNMSAASNNNLIPNTSKRYTSFTIDKVKGGLIWTYVDNGLGNPLYTNKLRVYVDKMDASGIYKQVEVFNVTQVNSNADITHFSHAFYKAGKYKIRVYSATNNAYINSGYMSISFK
ncbi:serine protease [uncultured Psychroserpens sp.]|uniref:S1C family serine protease n=1 Tax=uncultured Psychroserpens sp. TaxID=255436 RepID=UPI002623AF5D|nr:serine protease [uncultured Psychroserpens sp.]